MGIRILSASLVGSLGLLIASPSALMGQSESGKSLKIGLDEAVLTGEFRSELTWDDDGIAKEWEKDSATTRIRLNAAKLGLTGKLNPDVEYKLKLSLLSDSWQHGKSDGLIELANATWYPMKAVGIMAGKTRVKQGGWMNIDDDYMNIWGKSPYKMPFNKYANAFGVKLKVAGELSFELVNDVSKSSGPDDPETPEVEGSGSTAVAGSWNKTSKQPAFIFEYKGDFGAITPLLQVGQYDINHSRFFDVGIKAKLGMMNAVFDYLRDDRSKKKAKTSGEGFEDKALVYTNLSLRLDYTIENMAKPFVWFNSFERSGEKDGLGAAEDVKSNSVDVATGDYSFDDNAQAISVGSYFLNAGENWQPYLAIRSVSGKFPGKDGGDKTLRNNTVGVGVIGNF